MQADDLQIISAWAVGATQSLVADTEGTVNRTVFAETECGKVVLRNYRAANRKPIELEHMVIRYAYERGVPAIMPLELPNGETILECQQQFYALFPFASGRQVRRDELSLAEAAAMGTSLAHLHLALADFPLHQAHHRSFSSDIPVTLAKLANIEQAIRPDDPDRDQALATFAVMRDYIHTTPPPTPALASVPSQVIHGDFQERNIFFENNVVAAIIDWDQTYVASRYWEIMRTLHFVWQLAILPCRAFLAAYHRVLPLNSNELDVVAHWFAWSRGHHLWVFEATFLEKNDRTRQFIRSGVFTPLEPRWNALRTALQGIV